MRIWTIIVLSVSDSLRFAEVHSMNRRMAAEEATHPMFEDLEKD